MSATGLSFTSYKNRKKGEVESPDEPGEHTSKEANLEVFNFVATENGSIVDAYGS